MRLPAPGFPGYEVDEDGNVWRGDLRVKPYSKGGGYLAVALTLDGRCYVTAVHLLVLYAFGGPRMAPNHNARHLNGNVLDCRACNLAWGTPLQNADDTRSYQKERGRRRIVDVGPPRPYGGNPQNKLGRVRELIRDARAEAAREVFPPLIPVSDGAEGPTVETLQRKG